ncbi:MAG: aminodeoxychorismate synthase component I [Gemmataceae bacterium]
MNAPRVEELIPAPDPWDVAQRLAHLPHLLFFDSADRDSPHGRYSYVAANPSAWLTLDASTDADPLGRLAQLLPAKMAVVSELPPFQGGVAGLFGYGLCHSLERLPRPAHDEFRVPDIAVGRYDWVVSFDHVRGRAWFVSHDPRVDVGVLTVRAGSVSDVQGGPSLTRPARIDAPCLALHSGVTSNFDRRGYEAVVARAVEYIHAGDCFQVNLSQRLLAPLTEHPLDLYGRLRQRNPAPFAAYFDLGRFQIASASPERFLRVYPDGEVETRPIKGTRSRGLTPREDAARLHDLVTSAKDRAENVMIVDLMRNDLGRVCEYGSVRVTKVCEPESYRTVHHLVSEVRGKLRPGLTAIDLLKAAFPGGSVTGAPKVRAMEIITELEQVARGPYCGSLAWIGFDGAMDSSILIRTFTAGGGWVQFPVGGGIVADSDPAREYEETLHKAEGLLRALG